jgi:hypothetical protein
MPLHGVRIVAAGVAGLALLAGRVVAGQDRGTAEPAYGTWTIAPFLGYAQHSPVGRSWGVTPDRDHLFLGVHLTAPVLRLGPATLAYAPNLVPVVVLTNNPRYQTVTRPGGGGTAWVPSDRGPVVGAGLSPAGLQVSLRAARRLEFYGAGAVGALWFADAVPVREARRFNYTFEWGGGVTYHLGARRAVQVGYKFHHLSNLYTAPANPGVDANLVYAGLQWTTSRRGGS